MDTCPECGDEFERLGQHWHFNSDHRPNFTERQWDVLTGSVMGDGCVNRCGKNPSVSVFSITKEYLEYLDYIFGIFSTGPRLECTAEKNAKINRETGFSPNAKTENYSDIYEIRIRSHPSLKKLSSWYDSGEKVFPDDIEMSPSVLKHWYCQDGCYADKRESNHIKISMTNEKDNREKIQSYFTNAGLPTFSSWNSGHPTWTSDGSRELWEYMGDPPPGFEYKWPNGW